MDKKGKAHYKKSEEALLRACNFDPNQGQDQQANIVKVAERLGKMGAKRITRR